MMHEYPEIAAFFEELRKKEKFAGKEYEEVREEWLSKAAEQARHVQSCTHPSKFSHPKAETSSIIAKAPRQADGYLRSGNVDVKSDFSGTAAAAPVAKFLLIEAEGMPVFEHIRQDTELAKSLLHIKAESYNKLKEGFMKAISSNETMETSPRVKQVYFPVDDSYHQLSILSHSGMMFELRKRVAKHRFSESVNKGRELRCKNGYLESGYSEIRNAATIGYGGTKPQNISLLNSQNKGKARLLLSIPPMLEQREVQFPAKNFFRQSLRYYDCKDILERLHNIFQIKSDSQIPRDKARKGMDRCLYDILDVIVQKMVALREVSSKQFRQGTGSLPNWQQVWLCEQRKGERLEKDDWLNELCKQAALWINDAYKNSVKHPVILGEVERRYIKEFIDDNREVLR